MLQYASLIRVPLHQHCSTDDARVSVQRFLLSSLQSLSRVRLFATPWTAAHQASLSITNSQSLFKLMPIESVMPSNHFILCHPLPLLPPIFPSIRVFSSESVLYIRWPKSCRFSFSICPYSEYSGLISLGLCCGGGLVAELCLTLRPHGL